MGSLCCHVDSPVVPSGDDLVTPDDFVNELARHSGRGQDATGGRHVQVNIEFIETILLQGDIADIEFKRAADRKSTGFVSKANLEDAVNHVRFNAPTSDGPPTAAASRVTERKGTGFVTKEKLLHMLDELSDDEDTDMALPPAAAQGSKPADSLTVKERCKARKGTGFVTKSKLKKVLAAVGQDEDDEALG